MAKKKSKTISTKGMGEGKKDQSMTFRPEFKFKDDNIHETNSKLNTGTGFSKSKKSKGNFRKEEKHKKDLRNYIKDDF